MVEEMETHIPTIQKPDTHDNFVTERADVLQSKLLGDYNAAGKYVISENILSELLAMPKTKKSSFNNAVFCISQMPDEQELVFEITFKKNSQTNIATAQLSVLETVEKVQGFIINTLKTPVAKFTEQLTEDFVKKAGAAFNVTSEGNTLVRDERENSAEFINARKTMIQALSTLATEEYSKIYKDYFEKRMEVLSGMGGDFAATILANFNKEYAQIEKFFATDKNGNKISDYKAMNELLDNVFEHAEAMDSEFEKEQKKYREHILPALNIFAESAVSLESLAELKAEEILAKEGKPKAQKALEERQKTEKETSIPEAREIEDKIKRQLEDALKKRETAISTREQDFLRQQQQAQERKPSERVLPDLFGKIEKRLAEKQTIAKDLTSAQASPFVLPPVKEPENKITPESVDSHRNNVFNSYFKDGQTTALEKNPGKEVNNAGSLDNFIKNNLSLQKTTK